MARIAVGGLHHETNTFAPQLATYERFAEADGWPGLSRGGELIAEHRRHQPADHRLHRGGAGGRA